MHPVDLTVLYADDAMLVLDKPAGLLSVPGRGEDKQDCLSARAQRQFPDALIVHRLDMSTSGVMVLARSAAAQRSLNQAFASRTVTKRYIAIVDGHLASPPETWGVIDLPIIVDWPNRPRRVIDHQQGKPSVTRWRVLSHNGPLDTTRVELEPVTGRSHQLRVHLLALGHPIVGDALYGSPRVQAMANRLLLHACSVELPHPVTTEPMRFVSTERF
jgi:tRNA pseudouridine32 synthase/23S rRNA pseudouridine746 synthase